MYGAQASPRIPLDAGPDVPVNPSDARIVIQDCAGTITRTSTELYITRPIDTAPEGDTSNYKRATPGVLYSMGAEAQGAGIVTINVEYTSEIARNDPYNPYAALYVDGAYYGEMTGPGGKVDGDGLPQPSGPISYSVVIAEGYHTVSMMCPAFAAIKLKSFTVGGNVAPAHPVARPEPCVFLGDSLVHGASASRMWFHWTTRLSEINHWSQINLGNGGRRIVANDFTIAGSLGASRCVVLVGINNVLGGDSPAAIKSAYKTSLLAYRAAATAAGRPTSRLYVLTLLYTENSLIPGADLAAKLATVEAARQAIRDAVSEVADPYVFLREGAQGDMPQTLEYFAADKLHINDLGSEQIATVLAPTIM